jgi:hypothetical protein
VDTTVGAQFFESADGDYHKAVFAHISAGWLEELEIHADRSQNVPVIREE